MDKKYDAIIIGAGVIGSAISLNYQKKATKLLIQIEMLLLDMAQQQPHVRLLEYTILPLMGVHWHMKDIITGRTGRNIWNLMTKVDQQSLLNVVV